MTAKILIVDDDPQMRKLLRAILQREYDTREASSGEEALFISQEWDPDLVLLDLNMPGISGYETCYRLKALPSSLPPQVAIVSANSQPGELRAAFESGADDYFIKPVDRCDLLSRVRLHVRLRMAVRVAHELAINDSPSVQNDDAAVEHPDKVLATQDVAVFTLTKIAAARDNETGEHTERMRDYAMLLAKDLQRNSAFACSIDSKFLNDLYRSSVLHDIGKVGIPDEILLKPGPLTAAEFAIMQQHTTLGANILDQAIAVNNGGDFLAMSAEIARFHHERWDGTGYPQKLAGKEIPLAARIVALADVYDALTSERPYKEAWSSSRAKEYIEKGAGTQFDPCVVASFCRCYHQFVERQNLLPVAVRCPESKQELQLASA